MKWPTMDDNPLKAMRQRKFFMKKKYKEIFRMKLNFGL